MEKLKNKSYSQFSYHNGNISIESFCICLKSSANNINGCLSKRIISLNKDLLT